MRLLYTILLLTTSFFCLANTNPLAFSISASSTNPICGNDSIRISSTGCSGRVIWSNGEIANFIMVRQSGIYSATCETTSEVSNSISVTVLPTPNPPVVTLEVDGFLNVLKATGCVGEVVWSNGTAGATSIVVSADGFYHAYCRGDICNSSISNTVEAKATVSPLITTNKSKICQAETFILTATRCDGTVFWSNGLSGTTIQLSAAGSYYAYCDKGGQQSINSDTLNIEEISLTKPLISASNSQLCAGSTVTLSASPCTEGNVIWSNGSTGSSIQINTIGTYSAYCQNICGISPTSDIITITQGVSLPPAPFVLTDKTVICNGESATLTASQCNSVVVWSNGMTATSIQITQGGTYSAICRNQCGDSPASNSVIIRAFTLPPSPVIATTKTIICQGDSPAVLSAIGCPGTVIWNNGLSQTSISIIVSGTYTAVCSNICGQSLPSNELVIRASNLPTVPDIITSKSILCNAETAVLTASNCNGIVKWSNQQNGTQITVTKSGNYSATCLNICGESSQSASINIKEGNAQCTPIRVLKTKG
ncbi:MAG: hypothetical protein ACK4NY_00485 [Spirosomataceae bacterium]